MIQFLKRSLLIIFIACCSLINTDAQFFLNGSARMLDENCFELTPNELNSSGSIWNAEKINLNESFQVIMKIFLGCEDVDGADGIVFGFQPLNTSIGGLGGGIGFQDIVPSIGIEFDTWQNNFLSDPFYDHIAIIRDGDVDHSTANNLAGPVQAGASPDVEDCLFHELRVNWDANTTTLEVYFDCELRLTYTIDIVNDIFDGDPEVFWGFTSATGGARNSHQVCFNYTTFLDELQDQVMCPGGQVELRARGGTQYNWTPSAGLSDPTIANPVASPAQTTDYTVEILDPCGFPLFNDVTVEVAGDSVFFDLGPDTMLCSGEQLHLDVTTPTATYQWSNGITTPQVTVDMEGTYAVTVTRTDTFCISSDKIRVGVVPTPSVDLGPDLDLCEGESAVLRSGFQPADYRWQDGSTQDSLVVNQSGDYQLTLSNVCGTASDLVSVVIGNCNEVYIPNAFSPNDDGINDFFTIQDGGDVTLIHLFQIFDRWGNLVFEEADFMPNDYRTSWDGKVRGKLAQPGVYTYLLELSFRDGKRQVFSGGVNLVR